MTKTPKDFEKTILFLARKLQSYQYAFRGTSGLVLQEIEMNVQDIDIVCDRETALASNKIFKDYLLEEVRWQGSLKYQSYFGKFMINEILAEVYGQWQIKDSKGNWSEIFNASENQRREIGFQGKKVFVTEIETELLMFAKMGRWTAFHKIKKQFKRE